MKVPTEDWLPALAWLPRWDGLSPGARAAWLTIKPTPGLGALSARVGDELVAAGLMDPPGPKGKQHRLVPGARPLLRVLRAMNRVPVLDLDTGALGAYLGAHFTYEQMNLLSITAHGAGWRSNAGGLEDMVSSEEWVTALLQLRDASAAHRWEMPRRPASEPMLLADPGTLAALQRLVTFLKDHPQGVPLRQLGEILPDVEPRHRAAALAAGARYLFVFPALRTQRAEAWIGLLPAVVRRMGPPPPPPRAFAPAETFEVPFRLADMTTVLVDAATEPIPVRDSDRTLYVRSQKLIASRLPGLPEWVEAAALLGSAEGEADHTVGMRPGAAERIHLAVEFLRQLKLADTRSTGDRYQLVPSRAGQTWLALAEGERLKSVLQALRDSPQRVPGSWYTEPGVVDFFGAHLGFSLTNRKLDLRSALTAAFLSIPAGEMVPLDTFLQHHAQRGNPFLAGSQRLSGVGGWSGVPHTREGWERTWAALLVGFLLLRLVPLGGARLGRTGEVRLGFGLTDAGRFLLGAADDFSYAPPPEGEVVVQPDFEVVFLAPAPRVEAELGRFAERTGAGVGALFRVTRASVLRAAEQGLTADAVLGTLESVSRSGVPANVARQVRDWMKTVRRVRIRTAMLMDCPDAETAARALALGGARAARVTPTLLRLEMTGKDRTAFVKKLRERGIFVAE
jgi:hypothetical protein